MQTQAGQDTAEQKTIVDFIRIFFPDETEEIVAHRWAARLAVVLGTRVNDLRPETTLNELLGWAAAGGADSMDFVVVFEPELRMRFAGFLDVAEHVTFRQMVEDYAGPFRSKATSGTNR